jgi:hypothetical protein
MRVLAVAIVLLASVFPQTRKQPRHQPDRTLAW